VKENNVPYEKLDQKPEEIEMENDASLFDEADLVDHLSNLSEKLMKTNDKI
jgi:hypothetical protein